SIRLSLIVMTPKLAMPPPLEPEALYCTVTRVSVTLLPSGSLIVATALPLRIAPPAAETNGDHLGGRVLDRQVADRHVERAAAGGIDVDRPIGQMDRVVEAGGVDDGRRAVGADDLQVARDVEVAGQGTVLARADDRQVVGARGQHDDVVARMSVRLDD